MSADLNKMAVAFNTSVGSLEDELTQLILDDQISARIDSHAKVRRPCNSKHINHVHNMYINANMILVILYSCLGGLAHVCDICSDLIHFYLIKQVCFGNSDSTVESRSNLTSFNYIKIMIQKYFNSFLNWCNTKQFVK